MNIRQLWVLLVGFLGLAAAGCNTVEGVGEDIEAAGDAIEDSADETENELEE